jgi:hypothetical protein
MPEEPFKKIDDILLKAIEQSAAGGELGFALDGVVESMGALYEQLGKRKEIIDKLKGKMKKGGLKAKDWSPKMAQLDFLSRIERDLQLRYRTRIGAFRRRRIGHAIAAANMEINTKVMERIEK